MQLHELQPVHKLKDRKRVGRGGKRGKTSGRGMKGQKARAGTGMRPAERDAIKKLPKLRGHGKNRSRAVNADRVRPQIVNLSRLNELFAAGAEVTPAELVKRDAVSRTGGRLPQVKILGDGEVSKKLTITNCQVSQSAREAIEKAGGSIV